MACKNCKKNYVVQRPVSAVKADERKRDPLDVGCCDDAHLKVTTEEPSSLTTKVADDSAS
jgi:hypothetical protein